MFPRLVETKEEILTLLEIRGNKEESVDQSRPSRFLEDAELLSSPDLEIEERQEKGEIMILIN